MKRKFIPPILTVLSLVLAALACNMPGSTDATPTTNVLDSVSTSVAQTAAVMLTQNPPTQFPTMALPTTAAPPTATHTPTISPSPTPIPCNRAEFVSDVNYTDNTNVPAGTVFEKAWRLQNTGSCTWTSGYQVIFDKGDRMSAPDSVAVTAGTVAPGQVVDVDIQLTAPAAPGTYRGDFLLRAPDGTRFGIGPTGTGNFWVQIVVPPPTATPTATFTPTVTPTPGLIIIIPKP